MSDRGHFSLMATSYSGAEMVSDLNLTHVLYTEGPISLGGY